MGPETLVEGYSTLKCNGAPQVPFSFLLSRLGDFRAWSVGTFTIVATTQNFGIDLAGSAGGNCNPATFDGMAMTVTVETATGGAAPYPKMVTDDFVRTFRLAFDTSTVAPTTSDGVPCDFPLSAQVSLHLTQAAADYVYDSNAPCQCE